MARLLGLRLLRLEADVLLVPAQSNGAASPDGPSGATTALPALALEPLPPDAPNGVRRLHAAREVLARTDRSFADLRSR